ncbi:MAG: esterase [Proteobacteria bacterium]|nr:esterase [Pseudomonadota bacterium]
MKKVVLKEYDKYPYHVEVGVRVTDLHYQKHLSYDRLVAMTQHVRAKMLEYIGVSEMDMGDGVAAPMVPDLQVVMQGEALLGDRLIFETGICEIGNASFRIAHRVKKPDETPIAMIEISIVTFDYKNRKAVPLPETLKEGLEKIRTS